MITVPHGALLGALIPKTVKADEIKVWDEFVADSGSPLGTAHLIYAWGLDLPDWRAQWHHDRGRVPMISWGAHSTSEILNGSQDAYIARIATQIGALGFPVFVRWFWEMDGQHFAPEAENAANFIAAWKHVRGVFADEHVTNVTWVWCPNAWGFHLKRGETSPRAQAFYPGDTQVDWIAADAFNNTPFWSKPSVSFADLFGEFYRWAIARPKPLMVAATATVNDPRDPASGGAWIKAMSHTLRYDMPKIDALLYFDRAMETYTDPTVYPNQLDESPAKMAEWRRMASLPYFRTQI